MRSTWTSRRARCCGTAAWRRSLPPSSRVPSYWPQTGNGWSWTPRFMPPERAGVGVRRGASGVFSPLSLSDGTALARHVPGANTDLGPLFHAMRGAAPAGDHGK